YHNWSMVRVLGERSPGMSAQLMDDAFFGDHPGIPPYEPHANDDRPDLAEKIAATMEMLMGATELPPELEEDREKALALRAGRPNLAEATDAELVERALSISPMVREFFEPYAIFGAASSFALGPLPELCEGLEPSLSGRLISGIGDIDSVPPSQAIWDLGRMVRNSEYLTGEFDSGTDGLLERLEGDDGSSFLAALDELRYEHGARGPVEWDIASPTWETRPELVIALVDRMRFADDDLAPTARQARAGADRAAAEAELRAHLAGNEEALIGLDTALRLANLYVPCRERTKLTEMMTVHEIRVAVYELGRRMVERGIIEEPSQITMLTETELQDLVADPESLKETIQQRYQRIGELAARQEPFILYQEAPDPNDWPLRSNDADPVAVGDELAGVPGGPGTVIGRARVITDPGDPRGIEPGDIMIAPATDPAWTPLFVTAGGVVVDVGAPMSHAMIVSRELGVPCVTGVTNGSLRIKDGMLLEVDGGAGTVKILDTA
ncbi:MAG: PEP-utilizing enzyme, partial [Acidimicrobiales bacterium]